MLSRGLVNWFVSNKITLWRRKLLSNCYYTHCIVNRGKQHCIVAARGFTVLLVYRINGSVLRCVSNRLSDRHSPAGPWGVPGLWCPGQASPVGSIQSTSLGMELSLLPTYWTGCPRLHWLASSPLQQTATSSAVLFQLSHDRKYV